MGSQKGRGGTETAFALLTFSRMRKREVRGESQHLKVSLREKGEKTDQTEKEREGFTVVVAFSLRSNAREKKKGKGLLSHSGQLTGEKRGERGKKGIKEKRGGKKKSDSRLPLPWTSAPEKKGKVLNSCP